MKPDLDSVHCLGVGSGCHTYVGIRAHTDSGIIVETVIRKERQPKKYTGYLWHIRDNAFWEMKKRGEA